MRTLLLALIIALLTATSLFAMIAPVPLDGLAQYSTVIVVARVVSVSKPIIGQRYAKAKVTEVWKGAPTGRVKFLASPTWTCDISDGQEGRDSFAIPYRK